MMPPQYLTLRFASVPIPHPSESRCSFHYYKQLTRSISTFIARNRARNNSSNRKEFLRKRRRDESGFNTTTQELSSTPEELPTCARTDAVPVNRDLQMKYDIAKNEGGPLRRTVKSEQTDMVLEQHPEYRKSKKRMTADEPDDSPTLQRHPGLGERFTNLEAHLAVRYGACTLKDDARKNYTQARPRLYHSSFASGVPAGPRTIY